MPSESPYFRNFFAVEQAGTVPSNTHRPFRQVILLTPNRLASHSFSHLPYFPHRPHHQAIRLNPLLHDWMVPLEVPAMYYDCFSLVFLAMTLSNPFALSLQHSNSFEGDFIHLNNGKFPIGVCF